MNWSDQRHIKVSSDFAGNTWAPEAFYDEEAGEYVVYWASALYPTTDTTGRDINTSYQRMMYATTRDFVTFSEPQPWIDVKRGTGRGMIDATIAQDGDTYYRFVKDEAVMTPRQERSTDLRATVTGSLPTTTSTPRLAAGQGAGRRRPAQPVGRHLHPGRGPDGLQGQRGRGPLVHVHRPAELPRRTGLPGLPDRRHRQRRLAVRADGRPAEQPAPRHRHPGDPGRARHHAGGLPARPAHRVRRGRDRHHPAGHRTGAARHRRRRDG